MKHWKWALSAVVVVTALGCTPSPDKVCAHVTELVNKELKDLDEDHKPSEKDKQKNHDKCVESLTKEKEKKPDEYKCVSKCMMDKTTLKAALGCNKECNVKDESADEEDSDKDKKKKKKSDEESTDDEPKKKKKKSADDE